MDQLIYIGAALAVGLLIGLVALAVIWLRKTVVHNVRNHTLNLISAYDTILEEKSRELSELEDQIQDRKAGMAAEQQIPSAVAEGETFQLSASAFLKATQSTATAPYRDKAVGSTYQQIRQGFSYQVDQLLPMLERQRRSKGAAERLLEQLEFDTVYRLSTLSQEEQLTVLQQCLDGEGLALLNGYCKGHNRFRVLEFYNALQSQAAAESQAVRLYVGSAADVKARPASQVEVILDESICEGFQAELGGRLYDYSIKTRELS